MCICLDMNLKRKQIIGEITAFVESIKSRGKEIDKKELLGYIMSKYYVSRRTANEYILAIDYLTHEI